MKQWRKTTGFQSIRFFELWLQFCKDCVFNRFSFLCVEYILLPKITSIWLIWLGIGQVVDETFYVQNLISFYWESIQNGISIALSALLQSCDSLHYNIVHLKKLCRLFYITFSVIGRIGYIERSWLHFDKPLLTANMKVGSRLRWRYSHCSSHILL